jgi:hypothetical protein
MKCKDCQYCSQRGGYQYFFCDRDNSLIEPNDYYGGKTMDCLITKLENKDIEDYVIYNIIRGK